MLASQGRLSTWILLMYLNVFWQDGSCYPLNWNPLPPFILKACLKSREWSHTYATINWGVSCWDLLGGCQDTSDFAFCRSKGHVGKVHVQQTAPAWSHDLGSWSPSKEFEPTGHFGYVAKCGKPSTIPQPMTIPKITLSAGVKTKTHTTIPSIPSHVRCSRPLPGGAEHAEQGTSSRGSLESRTSSRRCRRSPSLGFGSMILCKVHNHTHTYTHIYIYIYMHTSIHTYIYIYIDNKSIYFWIHGSHNQSWYDQRYASPFQEIFQVPTEARIFSNWRTSHGHAAGDIRHIQRVVQQRLKHLPETMLKRPSIIQDGAPQWC